MADRVVVHEEPRLAVIPARAGSKRVPRKNVRLLGGQPMLAYTIDAARRLFLGSILYLPILWGILVWDHVVR